MSHAMKKSVHPSMPTKKNGNKKKSKKTGSTIGVERSSSVELGDAVNGVAKDPIAGGNGMINATTERTTFASPSQKRLPNWVFVLVQRRRHIRSRE